MYSLKMSNSYIKVPASMVARDAKRTIDSIHAERENVRKLEIKQMRNKAWRKHWLFRKRIPYFQACRQVPSYSWVHCGRQLQTAMNLYRIAKDFLGDMTISVQDAVSINLKLGEENG